MTKINTLIICVLLQVITIASFAQRTVTTINNSSKPIWVGVKGGMPNPNDIYNPIPHIPEGGGWYLAPNGGRKTISLPNEWEGRFWGRTACNFDGNGYGPCETGDCGNGLNCNGAGSRNTTLVELKFNGWQNYDYYNVSLIDGFNVPMQMRPVPGTYTPKPGDHYWGGTAGCTTDLNPLCPPELQLKNGAGQVVAWLATCSKWNIDKYCCYDNNEATCQPNYYSEILKSGCPDAYTYVTDHEVFISGAESQYEIIFPEPTSPDGGNDGGDDGVSGVTGLSGTYTLENKSSGLVMDVAENGNPANGTNILQWTSTGNPNQKFKFSEVSTGVYSIICVATGKSLDIDNGSSDNFANLLQWEYLAGANQHFKVEDAGSGYYKLRAIHSGKILEVAYASNEAGANIGQYDDNGQLCGQWKLITVGGVEWSTTIEAENYVYMSGVQLENCSEGGQNVCYINTDDWMVWDVNIPESGSYKVEYRVATESAGGQFQLEQAAGASFGVVNVPGTGGWQNWTTVSHVINLNAGQQQIAIKSLTNDWNINWLKITKVNGLARVSAASATTFIESDQVSIYPNPTQGELSINSKSLDGAHFTIYDELGKIRLDQPYEGTNKLDVSCLEKGIYTITIQKKTETVKLRFIKK